MIFHEQLLWAAALSRQHREFEPLLKEGRNMSYSTAGGDEAMKFLTTHWFQDVISTEPEDRDKYTMDHIDVSSDNR